MDSGETLTFAELKVTAHEQVHECTCLAARCVKTGITASQNLKIKLIKKIVQHCYLSKIPSHFHIYFLQISITKLNTKTNKPIHSNHNVIVKMAGCEHLTIPFSVSESLSVNGPVKLSTCISCRTIRFLK